MFFQGVNIGRQKCPLEKYFRSGVFNFQPNGFLTKKNTPRLSSTKGMLSSLFSYRTFKDVKGG